MSKKKFKVTEELIVKLDKRFFNYLIDMVMLIIILFIGLVFYISRMPINEGKEFMGRFMTNNLLQFTISSSVVLLYYNFFEILTSRTVGKFCTNTIVVDENGDRANYEAIMIRSLMRIIPLYWVSFAVFPTRGLHDVASKTYVVNKKELEEKKRLFNAIQNGEINDIA